MDLRSPDAFVANQFACPIPAAFAHSNVTCACSMVVRPSTVTPALATASVLDGPDGCRYCASGYFANASTSFECRACPAGTSSLSLALTTSLTGRLVTNEQCTLCEPGTFGNTSHSERCTACPRGSATSEFGKTECERCRPGFFANETGQRECVPCARGSFAPTHGQVVCELCPPGSYTAARGEAECLPCPIGQFQRASGQTECAPCPDGFVAPFVGHAVCVACPPGSHFDASARTCRKCPADTFTNTSAQLQCLACPLGTAADGAGNTACARKPPPGYGLNGATLTECPPGFFNNGSRLTCEPCVQGSYAPARGSHQCTLCARGTFSSRLGATNCERAPPGAYTDHVGAWKPQRCPPNQYTAVAGSSSCIECPWPSFSLVGGAVECASAQSGEVYDVVVWPRLAMTIAGISAQEVASAAASGALSRAWQTTLAGYGLTSVALHVITVESQTREDDLLTAELALEVLLPPLPRRQKRNSTMFASLRSKTATFQQFASSTRAAFERKVVSQHEHALSRPRAGSSRHSEHSAPEDESESRELEALVRRPGFVESLVRQLHRDGVADISSRVVRVAVFASAPLKSSRATPCPRGTFYSTTGARPECQLCPLGTFADSPGSFECTPCPGGTFADEEGLEQCEPCPSGDGARSGASACVKCYWFTYACDGFWQDVLLALALVTWYGWKLWTRCRRGTRGGDKRSQQQIEQAALLAGVRSRGRTGASVRYRPMVRSGNVSVCEFGSREQEHERRTLRLVLSCRALA